jgi:DNA replication and repair protein RecF
MEIKKIHMINFRSHRDTEISFKSGVNIIKSPNGTGKTNTLEALFLLSTSKSHRGSKIADLIMYDEDFAKVEIEFSARERDNREVAILTLASGGKKAFLKNGVNVAKTSDLMGFFNCVLFTPDDLQLIKGAPSARRRMMDIALCQMSRQYFYNLSCYNKALNHKNKLLKKDKITRELLEPWNIELKKYGESLRLSRAEYIKSLEAHAKTKLKKMLGKDFKIVYNEAGHFDDDIFEKEKLQRASLTGPHRDDLTFLLDDKDAKAFASQGQTRSIVVCLKMAQVDILNDKTGEAPILLLDDVLSELDETRRAFIEKEIKNLQVIITTC